METADNLLHAFFVTCCLRAASWLSITLVHSSWMQNGCPDGVLCRNKPLNVGPITVIAGSRHSLVSPNGIRVTPVSSLTARLIWLHFSHHLTQWGLFIFRHQCDRRLEMDGLRCINNFDWTTQNWSETSFTDWTPPGSIKTDTSIVPKSQAAINETRNVSNVRNETQTSHPVRYQRVKWKRGIREGRRWAKGGVKGQNIPFPLTRNSHDLKTSIPSCPQHVCQRQHINQTPIINLFFWITTCQVWALVSTARLWLSLFLSNSVHSTEVLSC